MSPELLYSLLVPTVLLLGSSAWLIARRTARTTVWNEVAKSLGIEARRESPLAPIVASGVVGGVEIRLRDADRGGHAEVEAIARCALPEGLALQRQTRLEGLRQRVLGKDLQVGDPGFDERILVSGSRSAALAALSAPARRRLSQLADGNGHLEVSLGAVHLTRRNIRANPRLIATFAEETCRLARALELPPGGITAALRTRATVDPRPSVQVASLESLVERFPRSHDTAQALGAGLRSEVPALVAAARRGTVRCADTPDEDQIELLLGSVDPVDRIEALHAIERHGSTHRTSAALTQLQHADVDIRIAAAGSLASVGSPEVVPALRSAGSGFLVPAALSRATELAVAAILARIEGAARGAVALHDDGQGSPGALSAVGGGELTEAEAEPGSGRRVPTKAGG